MSLIKPKPVRGIQFDADRHGFMCALSRRESSSNLLLPHNNKNNIESQIVINQIGYVGYFQFGEDALIDCGYYNPRKNNSDKSRKNNWTGSWTGKNNIRSLGNFRSSPEVQVNAFQEWVNILCNRIRNLNINEFYGKIINGTEITESGCIAGAHLKGAGSVLSFLSSNGKVNGKDGNNVGVSEYIGLLALYDLETCCNRKIYIKVEKNGQPVSGIEVKIESEYKAGKHYSKIGKIKNTYTTNDDGKIPVIVRHPGAVIKVTVNGKSQTIIQEASKRQSYTIDITGSIKATGKLDKPSTPQPCPVPDKSPQDQRNEQNKQPSAQPSSSSTDPKEVTFNITIVEGDTENPITNLRYYLVYKGNSKEHRTDNQGIESNITAEVGQDIEVCVAGDKKLQPVAHFKVSGSHEGKAIKVLLPVEAFNIAVKDNNKALVKSTKFMIFYRGRKIVKQTNSQGLINVKMLVGFVYKFGLADGTPLVTLRCLKGTLTQPININKAASNRAMGVSSSNISKTSSNKTSGSPTKMADKPNVTKSKPKPIKEESHTKNNGRPITSVIADKAASDTTRYHIYHNGKIKRQNGNATGYAEFIYYDEKGSTHYLGKSAYVPVNRLGPGNALIAGNKVYLVDQRQHPSYISSDKKLGYKWQIPEKIEGKIRRRYYLNGLTMAGTLGTLMKMGYQEYHGTGWSNRKGESVGSSTHRNGEAGDFRYLGKNNVHRTDSVHTTQQVFDKSENQRWVEVFRTFGFQTFYTGTKATGGVAALSGTKFIVNHHHHLHLGNQGSAASLKSRGILEDIN